MSGQIQFSFLFSVKGVLGTQCLGVLGRPDADLKVLDSGFGVDILLLPVSEPQSVQSESYSLYRRSYPVLIGITGK